PLPHLVDRPHFGVDGNELGRVDNLRIDHRDPRAAVVDDILEVGGFQKSVDRYGDSTGGDRTPESDRQPSRIRCDENDAFVMTSTGVTKDICEAAYRVVELAICHRSFAVDDRD